MKHGLRDILEATKYYIKYDYVDIGKSIVEVCLDENSQIKYEIKTDGNSLENSFDNKVRTYPSYYLPTAIEILLKTICEHYKYPRSFVLKSVDGNKINKTICNLQAEDDEKATLLLDLYEEINRQGLKKEHLDIARLAGIEDGFRLLIKELLQIDYVN